MLPIHSVAAKFEVQANSTPAPPTAVEPLPKTMTIDYQVIGGQTSGSDRGDSSPFRRLRPAALLFLSLLLAVAADHLLGSWLGFSQLPSGYLGIYRRVGPESGPQIFCAGSSLTVSALSWSKVSEALGEGIETWGVGGSSPDIWEEWQKQRSLSNVTIIGVSVYDLNEMHLADEHARVVPLSRTIHDLWSSHTDSALSHRVLTQYALNYVRFLFPTAGDADKVLVGLRSKLAEQLGRQASLAEHEGVVLQPPPPLLDAGESTSTVSEWSSARVMRRLAVLRAENRGRHEFFSGPKNRAFHRMLSRARQAGRVIVVVLPVSRPYRQEFLDDSTDAAFEKAIGQAMAIVPEATLVRLDRLPGISDPRYFFDLVHMNSFGRRLATQAFLSEVTQGGSQRRLDATPGESLTPGK
ncbi:MAG: hypothetical protein WAQ52_07380 [Terriglobales bacterium]